MEHKKEVFAWSMYDLANTAFSALFVTFFFPLYVKQFLGGNEFQIGLVFGLSMFFVAVFVPFIGAFSDELGRRLPFIVLFTVLCCFFSFLVFYANLMLALILGFLANFFYHAALTTYNAILPKISCKKDVGMVSGIGVAMGYLGTFGSLVVAWFLLDHYGWETVAGVKAMFPATALFFFGFSLITFFVLKEKTFRQKVTFWQSLSRAFNSVKQTIFQLRKHKDLLWFISAMFMYVNAINAVIVFLYLFGRAEIGLSIRAFMVLYIVFSIAAAFGAYISGKVSDWIGPKKTLGIAGILWLITLGVLLNVSSVTAFFIGGVLGGIALGTVWTAMRPLLLRIAPEKKVGQFFGFMELTDKFSGIIGPIVFGFLAAFYSYSTAIISLFVFFLAGLILLQKVNVK